MKTLPVGFSKFHNILNIHDILTIIEYLLRVCFLMILARRKQMDVSRKMTYF
jgi:hypothetical protein